MGRLPKAPVVCLTSLSFLCSFETHVLFSFCWSNRIAGVTLLFYSVTTFDAVADRLLLPVTCCSSDSVAPGGL